MNFRLVPKSVTLDDLERRYIALFQCIWYNCLPTHNRFRAHWTQKSASTAQSGEVCVRN